MKAALYARVSTRDQSPDSQLDALRAYAQARGLEVIDEYVDVGESGAKDRRPQLDRLLADARRRRFDMVVCQKLDRLARSARHLANMAADFDALGIDLAVIDQSLDTSVPSGKLLFHVLGAVAEFELALLRERTRAGVAAARRRGRRIGRPPKLSAEQLADARDLASQGKSVRAIAAAVGATKSTVHRTLNLKQ